jgi:adenine-specific DNA-methyltransferase
LQYTGQKDSVGRKFGTNAETSGRYHTNWLNMMYPRLKLARNLLRDDGVIFISIDDNEVVNLRKLCDEIFGEENFVANIVWQKKYAVSNDDPGIAPMHDHILVYRKTESFNRNLLLRTQKQLQRYKNLDNDPRGLWSSDN